MLDDIPLKLKRPIPRIPELSHRNLVDMVTSSIFAYKKVGMQPDKMGQQNLRAIKDFFGDRKYSLADDSWVCNLSMINGFDVW